MSPSGSVTHWIGQLQAGDQAAARQLWERYCQRLVSVARKRLRGVPRGAADEEDVAQGAFASLCLGIADGRFPQLVDRDNLWHLLVTITAYKALNLRRHELRKKRGGDAKRVHAGDQPEADDILEEIVGREPSPEFAAQVAEEFERLLNLLGDAGLRSVAVWKMEGYTTDEIAAKLGCVPRTVERRVEAIRSLWKREVRP